MRTIKAKMNWLWTKVGLEFFELHDEPHGLNWKPKGPAEWIFFYILVGLPAGGNLWHILSHCRKIRRCFLCITLRPRCWASLPSYRGFTRLKLVRESIEDWGLILECILALSSLLPLACLGITEWSCSNLIVWAALYFCVTDMARLTRASVIDPARDSYEARYGRRVPERRLVRSVARAFARYLLIVLWFSAIYASNPGWHRSEWLSTTQSVMELGLAALVISNFVATAGQPER